MSTPKTFTYEGKKVDLAEHAVQILIEAKVPGALWIAAERSRKARKAKGAK